MKNKRILTIRNEKHLICSILRNYLPLIINNCNTKPKRIITNVLNITNEKRKVIPARRRREVYAKYKNKCFYCHEKTYLDIHHKNLNSKDNRLNNLVLLCPTHHRHKHPK